ncbi:MAG: TerD family protein [Alphaproteobacteria bacterium]|jgi:stress response protein SCP2|nr:TerD family protein [Alphaproteobacteria bacterium]
MPRLEKGEHCSLNVTKKAEHRVLAGLGWEPHAHAGILDKLGAAIGLKSINHDLDLACLTFDEQKNLLGTISAIPGYSTDGSGRIYHSGDNVAGEGDGDDEQVSVELLKLDPSIHYIMFVATIKSGHTFGEIDSPEIRLADGYSNHNFLVMPLTHLEGKAKSAFAFASIYRKEEGWNIHNISTYIDVTALQKPNGALSTLLTKA